MIREEHAVIWGSFISKAEGKGVEPSTAFAATDFESAS